MEDTMISMDECDAIIRVQKEVAFKAGEQQGIQLVVDWVNENVCWRTDAPYKSTIDPRDWQAFLKERGI